ncbi:Sporulation related domain-containing protein [Pustulibacterium marinum]|uniref:Sporulation related domain-containing protein n=1 Tax=Pustulibacterium marinum TaxID=1224947 RepID=A0A1I7EU84_9FLAO|nr:SPOR domain-containing protein [Pustulibacterium marinum]SFU27448.1 Sporulation related domain-containing protein [Pustulibacterium marinum]
MQLEQYISDLLYRYQCVTVPGFGAFLTNYKSAQVHQSTNAFYPPKKEIAFNSQLNTNDGLLVKYISDVEKLAYDIVLEKVTLEVSKWNQLLASKETLELKNIGELWLNTEEKIQFSPSQHINYLTASFGLSSFVSQEITRETLQKEVVAIEEKTPITFTPEARKSPAYLKYAAIFVIGATVAGVFGYNKVQNDFETQQIVTEQKAQEKVEQHIQEATFFGNTPLELPTVQLSVEKKMYKYYIVAGAFRAEENADVKVQELKNEGYKATKIGQNKYGLWQVAFQGFDDNRDAINFMHRVRKDEKGAWLFVSKAE